MVKVYNCDVEMHIGGQENLNDGLIASVIISAKKGGVGTTNYIEDIATLVKNGYIDNVVIPKHGPIHDRIRWVERNYYPNENFDIVTLDWNSKEERYQNPKWKPLQEDWILKAHKLQPYQ